MVLEESLHILCYLCVSDFFSTAHKVRHNTSGEPLCISMSDLTGSQDGSVSLWEWGHQSAVATPRPAGTFAKVTRVRFSLHGNKFGVADSDGHLSLFQVACREGTARPFFVSTIFPAIPHSFTRHSVIEKDVLFCRITNATVK